MTVKRMLRDPEHPVPRTACPEIDRQLEKLSGLEDGWLDGEGLAPSIQGISWLASKFAQHLHDHEFDPYFYPTEDGNIQIEWIIEQRDMTLEIDLKTHRGYWHELDLGTNGEDSRYLDMNSVDAWRWVVERIGEAA